MKTLAMTVKDCESLCDVLAGNALTALSAGKRDEVVHLCGMIAQILHLQARLMLLQ